MEYVTYTLSSGFNIISLDCEDFDEAINIDEDIIDYASEFDDLILARIKELLK